MGVLVVLVSLLVDVREMHQSGAVRSVCAVHAVNVTRTSASAHCLPVGVQHGVVEAGVHREVDVEFVVQTPPRVALLAYEGRGGEVSCLCARSRADMQ